MIMTATIYHGIGTPRLIVEDRSTRFQVDVVPPRDVMLDWARETVRWLLHNGTAEERAELKIMADQIEEYLDPTMVDDG